MIEKKDILEIDGKEIPLLIQITNQENSLNQDSLKKAAMDIIENMENISSTIRQISISCANNNYKNKRTGENITLMENIEVVIELEDGRNEIIHIEESIEI